MCLGPKSYAGGSIEDKSLKLHLHGAKTVCDNVVLRSFTEFCTFYSHLLILVSPSGALARDLPGLLPCCSVAACLSSIFYELCWHGLSPSQIETSWTGLM